MERTKKLQAIERAAVSKGILILEQLISEAPLSKVALRANLQMLERHLQKLSDLDEKVKELMLDDSASEAEFQAECEAIDDVEKRAMIVKVKVDAAFHSTDPSQGHENSPTTTSQKRNFKLPKVELRKFSGDLTGWLGWWAQFQKIDEDEELHDSDKFSYLLQSMVEGSRAYDLVKKFPLSTENYPKAIEALKERFGNRKLLRQVYVRELIRLVLDTRSKEKKTLASLYDSLESSLRSLESLGVNAEQMMEFLFPMVESCLPDDLLLAWQRSPNFGRDGSLENRPMSELDYLMAFLKMEIDNEEHRKLARAGFGIGLQEKRKPNTRQKESPDDPEPMAAGLFSGNRWAALKTLCVFCDKEHRSEACFKAQKMSLNERKDKVQSKGACFRCLKVGHVATKCKVPVNCPICLRKHSVLLCSETPTKLSKERSSELLNQRSVTFQSNFSSSSEVLLRTLMVMVVNPSSKKRKMVRALIDCGSQQSYILEHTAKQLGLKPRDTLRVNHQLFGGTQVFGQPHRLFNVIIRSLNGRYTLPLQLLDQPQICGYVPRVRQGAWVEDLQKKGVVINDVDSNKSNEIEILIGADYLGAILTGRLMSLKDGLTATETKLGWALMGKQKEFAPMTMSVLSMTITTSNVQELWNLETIGILDPVEVKSKEEKEKEVQDHFLRTVRRIPEGRYSVSLPWISDSMSLPTNRNVSERRLRCTTRKLNALDRFAAYDSVFRDWEAEGIISVVNNEEHEDERCHYLPHRPVFKESLTTPVHPVFDASCKMGNKPSLNNCLEKGPNLLELIPSILLRFRMGNIGVVADIRKAFLMVDVNPDDRRFLRFLWWEDSSQMKMKVYQHNRVVFGMNCSPFLLGAVISYHLQNHLTTYPNIIKRIQDSLYVDNLVTAVDNFQEYQEIQAASTEIMQRAGMELRQWERSKYIEENELSTVLGMKWNKGADTLYCEVLPAEVPEKITKRVILSQIQRIFDPLGFLCPVLIMAKVLLQQAWTQNKKWDLEVEKDVARSFQDWWSELRTVMSKIQLPRRISDRKLDTRKAQLHVFSDASQKAYAAVIFLRIEENNEIKVHLVQGKARVAPLKQATIPRLELLSCTIATRLMTSVKRATAMENIPTYFWSDSTTALAWIRRMNEWGTFVGNRVKEIAQLSKPEQWRHVPGKFNPADLPSRGISPVKFLQLRWWEGPDWLKLDESQWPQSESEVDENAVNQERRRISTLTSLTTPKPWYFRSNSYSGNLRILAFVRRFINLCRRKKTEKTLNPTPEELDSAETCVFKIIQSESFKEDSKVICGLRVEKDAGGIIRVRTKLLFRKDYENFKRPILLPNKHPVTEALILEQHLYNSHAGAQFLMGCLREKVWIVQGRTAIKTVIRSCVICRRFEAKKQTVQECALPEDRVQNATAFQVTGIDLAGPLVLKNQTKVYIVLFTCAVYRCVHLEVSKTLSTDDFLLAFVRFCKRKRRPEVVYSDNGLNFVGAVNLFKRIDWKEVERKTRQQRISWKFNPPSAPWCGGWWERLIRSVKDLMKRMLGFKRLNYVELETCLCEVESVVNHRPLTFVTEDQEDLIPLTPAMFIHDLPNEDVPETQLLTVSSLEGRRKNLKILFQELRDRFRKEYLGQLVQRGKERKNVDFRVGDIVLVERDNHKRILWPIARIVELIKGKDGIARVAKLKTKTGSLVRPLQRLFPLEVDTSEFAGNQRCQASERSSTEELAVRKKPKSHEGRPRQSKGLEKSFEGTTVEVKTRSGRIVKKPVKL